ncbi:MAG: formylglycine-generating enzyme family protein [Planctomycetota bacterium]|nr:formylglycine-generating enzyme family protein [Planctomycetota bacterium]
MNFLILILSLLDGPLPTAIQDPPAPVMESYTEKIPGSEIEITWIAVPVGQEGYPDSIRIGSPDQEAGRNENEGPTWTVKPAPFWIMKCEVTWEAFDLFREEYGILQQDRISSDKSNDQVWADAVSIPTPLWEQDSRPILEGLGTKDGYPVADITQFAAMQFSNWLSKKMGHPLRLPTEAEWEYAARCGQQTAFSFGDDPARLSEFAWYFDNSEYDDPDLGYPGLGAGYRKVGTLLPNRWGIHDLYGNVAEWTLDAYQEQAYADRSGKVLTAQDAVIWPEKIWPAVVRGGSWQDDPEQCRSAARVASTRKWQKRDPQIPKSLWWCTDAFHVGFRLIRPVTNLEAPDRWWNPQIESIQRQLKEGYKELRVTIGKADAKKDE